MGRTRLLHRFLLIDFLVIQRGKNMHISKVIVHISRALSPFLLMQTIRLLRLALLFYIQILICSEYLKKSRNHPSSNVNLAEISMNVIVHQSLNTVLVRLSRQNNSIQKRDTLFRILRSRVKFVRRLIAKIANLFIN
ncbi:hypothetical protein PMAYCL1PPCAC_08303 [Pristionchus mayeri]|uniref:Uncharacterized protein n=1 Tax=Pristionchus mayeri TaxID=1317129 RepID=A0AAN4ZBG4_9BILA|nr:hypothetical protein PMAYCL1PPCAC_08303 [Pristionchus mayeri]